MNSLKNQLANFFFDGGKGTNAALASRFGVHPASVREGVRYLRSEGMSIVKQFPTHSSSLTVYSYQPLMREGLYPVIGRPRLPR